LMPDPNAALFAAAQAEQQHLKIKDPPTLSVKDGVGSLTFPALSLTNHEKGKQIPTRSRWEGKTLKFVVNEAAMAFIRHHWPNYREPITTNRTLARQEPMHRAVEWKPRLEQFAHQRDALAAAYGKKAFAYFMDMGTGKSKCLIDEMAELYACRQIDRAVIIAPTGVHRQWIEEQLPTHWPTELRLEAAFLGNGAKAGIAPVNPTCMTVYAVNIEALTMMPMVNQLLRFIEGGRTLVAIDESQKIKEPGAERSKRCHLLGESAAIRRILTGTPMAKGPEDYFSQFKFLDLGIIGVASFTGFKRQYCQLGGFNNKSIIGYWNTDRLHELIAPYSFRVEKKDCIDLPPKLFSRVTVELSADQRATYHELRTQLLTELSDGTIIEAEQAVQRILRLQQVVQGFLPREDGGFDEFDITNRLEAVDDLVNGAKGKVVIWCRFRHDIDSLMRRYGNERAVRYDGSVGSAERERAKASFMDAASPVQIFVSNAQAGGAGLNLAGLADTVVYFSNSFSSLDRWQSEDRTHRIGTRGTVNYYDLVCRGTIDTAILANLRRKRDITDMSLTELRSLIEGSDD
jgi:hypothetical protein